MKNLWRFVRYHLIVFASALAAMVALAVLVAGVLLVPVGGVGLVLVPRMMAVLHRWTEWQRVQAGAVLEVDVPPRPAPPAAAGVRDRWRQLLLGTRSRRDLRWTALHVAVGLPVALVALGVAGLLVNPVLEAPLWWLFPADEPLRLLLAFPVTGWERAIGMGVAQVVLAAPLAWWALPRLARLHARACLAALAPSEADRLAERVGELTESRSNVLDAHAAELRRIERDLHDGTQARLVAIAMRLAMAREALDDDGGPVGRLLKDAHEGTEEAMTELRQVIRTMYPPILADRGLAGAVSAVTAQAGLPVETDVSGLGAVPAAVETAAYFIVAEAVTNATKHSGAARVAVRLASGRVLRIEISDDGKGGVDESRGTGVTGIRRRAAALDGTVSIDSPSGGPTRLVVELPCAS
ncbi:sensor domain-containing protein [Nonomuraea sp. NPDC051191]|uniref:sensor histidine kinase n=1 Tax=Nonomuraea sp. NPDC051191 TaxID=3364372 RepID=UPI00378FA87C